MSESRAMGAVVVEADDYEDDEAVAELVGDELSVTDQTAAGDSAVAEERALADARAAAEDRALAEERERALDGDLAGVVVEMVNCRGVLERYQLTEDGWARKGFEERLEHVEQLDAALLESDADQEMLDDVSRREQLLADLRVVAKDTLEQFSGMLRLNDEMRALGVFVADDRSAVYVEPPSGDEAVGDDVAAGDDDDDANAAVGDLAADLVDAFLPGALNDAALAEDFPLEPGLGDDAPEDAALGDVPEEPLVVDLSAEVGLSDAAAPEAVDDFAERDLDVPDEVLDETLAYGERTVDRVAEAATVSGESARAGSG